MVDLPSDVTVFRLVQLTRCRSCGGRAASDDSGELAAVVELRRHFPLIEDNERLEECKPWFQAGVSLGIRDR